MSVYFLQFLTLVFIIVYIVAIKPLAAKIQ